MKLPTLVTKYCSSDKSMYFLSGAWIVALGTPFGWCGIIIATIIALLLSSVKEKWLHKDSDWYNVLATTIGCISTIIIYLIISLLI